MKKILTSITSAIVVAFSGLSVSVAQDDMAVPDLIPIELMACSFRDGQDQSDYDRVNARMVEWMEDNDSEPYAGFQLNPIYAGNQDFDFVYVGVWANGSSMGTDITEYAATAGDISDASNEVVDCPGSSMYTSLQLRETASDGPADGFVLTLSDCEVAKGRSVRDAIDALREYGAYRDASGAPTGGTWVWFPTLGNGEEDFDFKLANSYANVQGFGDGFQWNRDQQAYIKRTELFGGLLSCNTARGYVGDTIVNTLAPE